MSGWWKCPCGDMWMSHKCGCGNDHYSTDGIAVHDDGTPYDGPRLCSYDQYRACENTGICHGNLINGHCKCDTTFKPKDPGAYTHYDAPEPTFKFDTPCPMQPDGGPPYYIDSKAGRTNPPRRTEEEIWSSPYCAVNRGACAIEDSESGETCRGVGFCIWRLASETFNPWAVDLCLQNTNNIIADSAAVGTHSPHYHEDADRYKETLSHKPDLLPPVEESTPVMEGQNLEDIMGVSDRLDEYLDASEHLRRVREEAPVTREQAYGDAMATALEEDQRKLDVLSTPNVVLPQEEVDRLLGRQQDTRNPKDVAGSTKLQYHLVPVTEGEARVMMLGARKYGPYNWREKRIAYTAYVSACMRHLKAFMEREDVDPESGSLHVEHASMCLSILCDGIAHDTAIDDRPHNPKVKS